ncbi:MAG: hypothetical protein ACJ8G4_06740 [Burkholderiales bacterium]
MATRREMLLRGGLIAAVTASLGLFAAGGDPPAALVAGPAAPPAQRPAAKSESVRIELLRRDVQTRPEGDAFAAHSWQPPPPPPPRPKLIAPEPDLGDPPPAPAAPPLPFTFLGAFEATGGKRVLYIVEGDKVHAVSEGESVNELYQVEAVGADEMVFMYLPLKLKQTLSLGNAK